MQCKWTLWYGALSQYDDGKWHNQTWSQSNNYVLRSSGISRKLAALIVIYIARKRNEFLNCFLLFWESFNCSNPGTTGPIQVGVSAKCTSPNEDFNQIKNWKCHLCYFRLIPQDRITYYLSFQNKIVLTSVPSIFKVLAVAKNSDKNYMFLYPLLNCAKLKYTNTESTSQEPSSKCALLIYLIISNISI